MAIPALDPDYYANWNDLSTWIYFITALFCVTCAALAAGLTLGILSLDSTRLQIKEVCGTPEEIIAAKKIRPVLEDRHRLLCTLLIFNSIANEALPIFLDALVPSVIAVFTSVTLVLIFGEVLPAAFFTGPNQLFVASKFVPLVNFLMFIFYPLARPMGKCLDQLLGSGEEEQLNRDELTALMHITRISSIENASSNLSILDNKSSKEILSADEVNQIQGVLGLSKKSIKDIMINMEDVFILSSRTILDLTTLQKIDDNGHSRIPICQHEDSNHILGYLLVKKLITVNPEQGILLSSLNFVKPIIVSASQSINEVLKLFQAGPAHLALVTNDPIKLKKSMDLNITPDYNARPLGIVTIEDIFEEILQQDILDEKDLKSLNNKRDASASAILRAMVEREPKFARAITAEINSLLLNDNDGSTEYKNNPVNPKLSKSMTKYTYNKTDNNNKKKSINNESLNSDNFAITSKQSLLDSNKVVTKSPFSSNYSSLNINEALDDDGGYIL